MDKNQKAKAFRGIHRYSFFVLRGELAPVTMMPQDRPIEVQPWTAIPPPPPPPGPPPRKLHVILPPPPPPHPRSPRKRVLKPAPSLEDTVALTFTSSSSMSRSTAEERRRFAKSMYSSNDPVEIERMENATVATDSPSVDFIPAGNEELWDPVMMDRLSPTEETVNEFREARRQKPAVKSVLTTTDATGSPKEKPMSPVSEFRSFHSPPSQASRSQASFTTQSNQFALAPKEESPRIMPPSPVTEFRNFHSPRSQATGVIAQRSPLSTKQNDEMLPLSKEKLRAQSLITTSFSSVDTSSVLDQSYSTEGSSVENPHESSSVEDKTESSSVENKADGRERSVRFPGSAVSSITEDPMEQAVQPAESSNMSPKHRKEARVQERGERRTDKNRSRRFLKFIGMLNSNSKESMERRSPAPKTRKMKKKKKAKTNWNDKIGAPRDLRPGMSYKSTPNSAEIVVRRPVGEHVPSSDEEEKDEIPSRSEESKVETFNEPPAKERARPTTVLTVSTSIDEVAELDPIDSFSPPRFDNIEEVTGTFSTSPTSQDITLPSDNDRRFKCSDAFSSDEMSSITDPTFGARGEKSFHDGGEGGKPNVSNSNSVGEGGKSNTWNCSDPLGHYWSEGQNAKMYSLPRDTVDPFTEPFFEDQASDVTSPVVNLSHSFEEDHTHVRTPETEILSDGAPDDEIEVNWGHDTGDKEPAVTRQYVDKPVTDSNDKKNKIDNTPDAPRNEISARHEITERRKEEKPKIHNSGEGNVRETPQSKPAGKSAIYTGIEPGVARHYVNKSVADRNDQRQKFYDTPVAPRNEISGRRHEIMERRILIEEKAKSNNAEEENVREAPQSKLTVKAVAYLRHQNELFTQTLHSDGTVPTSAARISRVSSRDARTPLETDKAAYAALNVSPLSRGHQVDASEPPFRSSTVSSFLVKLQGRKVQTSSSTSRIEMRGGGVLGGRVPSPAPKQSKASGMVSSKPQSTLSSLLPTPQRVDRASISRGIDIKRRNRELLMLEGKDVVVLPQPRKRQYVNSTLVLDESKIKDPIKRAGLRLLAKAALPIQCRIRRYLAQQAAVDRLWAIIELQSYFRRWKCEAFLLAHTYSATKLQAAFRGWQDRDMLETTHYCATQIQKIARSFLVSISAFDSLYRVILVQAAARGLIAKNRYQRVRGKIIQIQKCFRGFQGRLDVAMFHVAATIIQSMGRGYLARLQYQFALVDIIVTQSVARRWLTVQQTSKTRKIIFVQSVARRWMAVQRASNIRKIIIVQSVARRWAVVKRVQVDEEQQRNHAACKIQAVWRSFQATTNLIFALADIIIVQRTVRQWLAVKELKSLQWEACATKIQTLWRGYKARMGMLYRLVDIIITQVCGF